MTIALLRPAVEQLVDDYLDTLIEQRRRAPREDLVSRLVPLIFGVGAHFCIGAALARLQGEIALSRLLGRFRRIELAGAPAWRNSIVLRGVRTLPLAVTSR